MKMIQYLIGDDSWWRWTQSPIYSSLTILTLEKSINQMKRATKSPTFSTLMASTPSLGTTNLIGMISCGTTGKIWRGGGRMFWNQTPHDSKFTIVSGIIQILMPIQGFKQNNHGFFNDRSGRKAIEGSTNTQKHTIWWFAMNVPNPDWHNLGNHPENWQLFWCNLCKFDPLSIRATHGKQDFTQIEPGLTCWDGMLGSSKWCNKADHFYIIFF